MCASSVWQLHVLFSFFFFNDTATTEIYTYRHTLSLHDALPISDRQHWPSAHFPEDGHFAIEVDKFHVALPPVHLHQHIVDETDEMPAVEAVGLDLERQQLRVGRVMGTFQVFDHIEPAGLEGRPVDPKGIDDIGADMRAVVDDDIAVPGEGLLSCIADIDADIGIAAAQLAAVRPEDRKSVE